MMMLMNEDCLKALSIAEDNSIDSLITDPPAGISFMGKDWDSNKGGRDQWITWMSEVMRECYRVLKPGAHGLVWAIPRTSHWTATALENAGFEIRDVVTHIFGQGFPKSMDLSKAIDKAAGVQREVIGFDASKLRPNRVDRGYVDGGQGFNPDNGATITAPATDAAKQWSGFGTSLKPAAEMWILVRKPLSEKTVAANVLKHGTGGLNIDGCRVGLKAGDQKGEGGPNKGMSGTEFFGAMKTSGNNRDGLGRFPANLVLSHNGDCDEVCTEGCAVVQLDEQSGILKSGDLTGQPRTENKVYGSAANALGKPRFHNGDSGGASRFFYCAKASKKDKGTDNNHPTVKSTKLMEYLIKLITPPNGIVLDPFMGSGSTGVAAKRLDFGFVGIERDENYFDIANKRLNPKT